MSELSSKQRNNLPTTVFGVKSLRKYPMNDKEHVIKAIQFFHHCPLEHKKELAINIYRQSKKYNIDIKPDSPIYEYLPSKLKEDINFILVNEDIDKEFDLLMEALAMREDEAKNKVDSAINLWKQRKKNVKDPKAKNSLLIDVKTELNLISDYQRKGSYDLILQRAGQTANRLQQSINKENYAKRVTNRVGSGAKGINSGQTRMALQMAGSVAAGALAGVATNKIAKKNGTGFVKRNLAGAGVGLGAATAGIIASGVAFARKGAVSNDPNKPLRQYGDKYLNFLSEFRDEVLSMDPSGREESENNG